MSDSITNALAEAIKTTLQSHLKDKLPAFKRQNVHWHFEPEVISAAQCPAIGIFDERWTTERESIRGHDPLTNAILPGIEERRCHFNIDIYLKGQKIHELRTELNEWTDAVVAVLRDEYDLGGEPVYIIVNAGDPVVPVEIGSNVLMVARVEAQVGVCIPQGATTM